MTDPTLSEIMERLTELHATPKNWLAGKDAENLRFVTQPQLDFYYAAHEHFPALVTEIERQASEIERLREWVAAVKRAAEADPRGYISCDALITGAAAALNEKEPHATDA